MTKLPLSPYKASLMPRLSVAKKYQNLYKLAPVAAVAFGVTLAVAVLGVLPRPQPALDPWRPAAAPPPRYAYVFYAARPQYLCGALINLQRLARLNADPRIERVVLVAPDLTVPTKAAAALAALGARAARARALPGPDGDSMEFYRGCMAKLSALALAEYDRVVVVDADTLVMKRLDALFALPPALIAAPRAYWLDPGAAPASVVVDVGGGGSGGSEADASADNGQSLNRDGDGDSSSSSRRRRSSSKRSKRRVSASSSSSSSSSSPSPAAPASAVTLSCAACDPLANATAHVGHVLHAGRQMKFTSALLVVRPSAALYARLLNRYFPGHGGASGGAAAAVAAAGADGGGAAAAAAAAAAGDHNLQQHLQQPPAPPAPPGPPQPPALRHGMYDMDLLNLEFKDEASLLPGPPLFALSTHWVERGRTDRVWSAGPPQGSGGSGGDGGEGDKEAAAAAALEALYQSAHLIHFSEPGKPWDWSAVRVRGGLPNAHPRLYDLYDTWHNASAALC